MDPFSPFCLLTACIRDYPLMFVNLQDGLTHLKQFGQVGTYSYFGLHGTNRPLPTVKNIVIRWLPIRCRYPIDMRQDMLKGLCILALLV